MKLSIKEGSFAGVSLTGSDNFIIPYALALQANNVQVGILSSLAGIISPSAQIVGSRMMESHLRKRILVTGVFLQALMWLSYLALAFLFINNISVIILPILLIIFYIIYQIFGNIAGPPWFSLMGDVVPEDHRGRYFAKRNLITTVIALSSVVVISIMLDIFKIAGLVLYGFCIFFIIALICRSISAKLLSRHYYPPFTFEKSHHVSLRKFIREIPKENFGRFTLYVALINFGQMIAGPFFPVYMLSTSTYGGLGFDYFTFIVVNLSASFLGLLIFPLLGRFSDKFGNIAMLRISSIALPLIPILWAFFSTPPSTPLTPFILIIGPQVLSGFGWTAFNLAASNFIYDSIVSEKRGLYVAYYNFILGIGIVGGGLLGSYIISLPTFINHFHFIFLVSGIVRAIIIVVLLFRIKEVRQVPGISHFYFRHFNMHRFFYESFGRKENKPDSAQENKPDLHKKNKPDSAQENKPKNQADS